MSCLFNSLRKCFASSSSLALSHLALRLEIMAYLARNPIIFDDISASTAILAETGEDLQTYVRRMSKTSEWGGGLEIKAFCNLFGKRVHVHYNDDGDSLHFDPEVPLPSSSSPEEVHLLFTGNHYEHLRRPPPPQKPDAKERDLLLRQKKNIFDDHGPARMRRRLEELQTARNIYSSRLQNLRSQREPRFMTQRHRSQTPPPLTKCPPPMMRDEKKNGLWQSCFLQKLASRLEKYHDATGYQRMDYAPFH